MLRGKSSEGDGSWECVCLIPQWCDQEEEPVKEVDGSSGSS